MTTVLCELTIMQETERTQASWENSGINFQAALLNPRKG